MQRRHFITTLGALSASSLTACRWGSPMPPVTVFRPGMQQGHAARDAARNLRSLPTPTETLHCDVAILGSGAAGISAAWQLARGGYRNFILLDGPAPHGNLAGDQLGGVPCPSAAHYLPLPSTESRHVREMLGALGVIHGDPFVAAPEYDESVLVHPLHERLRVGGQWQDALLPNPATADQARFVATLNTLRDARGRDGRRVFVTPIALSSRDEAWRALDRLSLRDWLLGEKFHDAHLHWHADYICRDEFGARFDQVSAWAGLHYFASRNGLARNAEPGSVLTWPDGLNTLARQLLQQVAFDGPRRRLAGTALRVQEQGKGVEVLVAQEAQGAQAGRGARMLRIQARQVICAMPLHAALHVVEGLHERGLTRAQLAPQAPWLVGNFLLRRFPTEAGDTPLAWDNVLRDGRGLGYVVATHQLIRSARPERTVFTTYQALADMTPEAGRHWMTQASDQACLARAAEDLLAVYDKELWPLVESVHLHLHGHAMSVPVPGFLQHEARDALRSGGGRIRFAHADLSGYSVFEEAAWWGTQQALSLLGG